MRDRLARDILAVDAEDAGTAAANAPRAVERERSEAEPVIGKLEFEK